ncbi:unnamed protein product [Lasius platythorax]
MDFGHLLVILTLLCTGLQAAAASEWGYWGKNGPESWPGICTTGKIQSPIDIVTKDAKEYNGSSFIFYQHNLSFPATLDNNGHSVGIKLHGAPVHIGDEKQPMGYVLEQMHFHWGAEHTVDGLRDPLELHLVHYNPYYANFSEAAQHPFGIVVVSVLFKLSRYDNPHLKPIVEATKKVSCKVGRRTAIRGELIPSLLLPKNRKTVYYYIGSLTTPGCQENVGWFVLTEKLTVSQSQVNVFKRVRGDNGRLLYNYRPTQKLNDRVVLKINLG